MDYSFVDEAFDGRIFDAISGSGLGRIVKYLDHPTFWEHCIYVTYHHAISVGKPSRRT